MVDTIEIGVISDTHGLVRPEAIAALRGVERILHAGDVGSPEVLAALSLIAPVTAVRGNNDHGAWADRLPETAVVEVGGLRLYVLHDLSQLDVDPSSVAAVIAGHSHRPSSDVRGRVLYFNPGSAGPRRFKLPVSVGRLRVRGDTIESDLLHLAIE